MKKMINFLLFSTPTKDQRVALDGMEQFVKATNEEDFLILKGAAGTGKTSMISALVFYLVERSMSYKIAH
jgi:exodeoxyribonuclease V